MIYKDLELNYEKLTFQGEQSLHTAYSLKNIGDIVSDFQNINKILSPVLPIEVTESILRIVETFKMLKTHYSHNNYMLDDIFINKIRDKEFMEILEISYNFFIPLLYKMIIKSNLSNEVYENRILPALIVAEGKIILSAEYIFQEKAKEMNSNYICSFFPKINAKEE